MKNHLILFFLIFLASCTCDKKHCPDITNTSSITSITGNKYVCGQIYEKLSPHQMGIIIVSEDHDNSFKVFYDKESLKNKLTEVKPYSTVCFQVDKIRNVPFAKSFNDKSNLQEDQLFKERFTTSFFLHNELKHDASLNEHKKTHIFIPPSGVTSSNFYLAIQNQSDVYNSEMDQSNMKKVLIPDDFKRRVDTTASKIFYAKWSNMTSIDGKQISLLDNIDKCHSHRATKETCIEQ